MGILDGGFQIDPAIFGSAGPPGWLGLNWPQPGPGPGFADQLSPSATFLPVSLTASAANAAVPARAATPASVAATPNLAEGTAGAANPFAAPSGNVGPPAAAVPPATPGIGDRLGAAFMNFTNARGFLPALGGAVSGLATGQRNDLASIMQAQQDAATQALVHAGLSPALAQAAALNPALLQAIAARLMRAPSAAPAPQPRRPAAPMKP